MENLLSTKIKNSINELNETIKNAVAELHDVIETNLLTLDNVKKNLVYAHTELEEIGGALYDASTMFENTSCECDECVEMLEDVLAVICPEEYGYDYEEDEDETCIEIEDEDGNIEEVPFN